MINRVDLDLAQLERDAAKEGAWQAKLAYSSHVQSQVEAGAATNETINLAKVYLNEIIAAKINDYHINALYLNQLFSDENNYIELTAAETAYKDEKIIRSFSYRYTELNKRTLHSPEVQYKLIRATYDNNIDTKKEKQLINKLSDLLHHEEITDTLRAKIYFQLIRFNIQCAREKGQRIYLETAKKYCLLLINDPTLDTMSKAAKAKNIHNEIQPELNKPVLAFSRHMQDSFETGKKVSRYFFKYIGILAGNILDICLLAIPKIFGKNLQNDDGYVRSNKTFSGEFFTNNGFATGFKWLGKQFGKHIFGNLISGPISALLGLAIYPFQTAYRYYKKADTGIMNVAAGIIEPVQQIPQSAQGSTRRLTASIFAHKKDKHDYGNIKTEETENNPSDAPMTATYLSPKGGMFSYGRVLNRKAPDNVIVPLVPVLPNALK